MASTRSHGRIVLALAPLLLAVSLPGVAARKPPPPPVPTIDWQPCIEGLENLDCAYVKVPLDYRNPYGHKTTVALARVPAADRDNRIGTLFLNPGGPGGSGIDMIYNGWGDRLNRILGGRFDIVGFDPRGVGESAPIQCWDSNEDQEAFLYRPVKFPYRAEQERPFFEKYRSIAFRCFSNRNNLPTLSFMTTGDVARDLDLLRRAVGDSRLNYLGYSYGSYIGSTYANLFPRNIRAMVIDGVLDPRQWSSGWQIKTDRVGAYHVLLEFFRQCDLAGKSCALGGERGSKARFDAILAEAKRQGTIVIGEGDDIFEYGYDEVAADASSSMYTPELWPDYANFLDLLGKALAGDKTAGRRALASRRTIENALADAAPVQRMSYNNSQDVYFANHCSEVSYPYGFQWYSVIGRYAEAGSFLGPNWWWLNSACAAWPKGPNRYTGSWKTGTSSRVLVVGNYFDPATNYRGAVETQKLLRGSRLLSYAGWGHVASYIGRSQCVDDFVTDYLVNGTVPPKKVVCPAAPNPFVQARINAKAGKALVLPTVGLPTLKPLTPARRPR